MISKIQLLILLIFFLTCNAGASSIADSTKNQEVKFEGMTRTLVKLLKTRMPGNFTIGDYEISLESLVDDDIAGVFDCDSVIMHYLTEAGENANYEMLSYEIENMIQSRFNYDNSFLYVIVTSDTTNEGMYINMAVDQGIEVPLPVVLHASDTSFSTSFDTLCKVEFNASIDLFINTSIALSGPLNRAVQVRINTFTFELTSLEDEESTNDDCYNTETDSIYYSVLIQNPPETIPFDYGGVKFDAATRCFKLQAGSSWYLKPGGEGDVVNDEGESYKLTIEQIEKGDYIWEKYEYGSVEMGFVMIPAGKEWDSIPDFLDRAELQYHVEDVFDENSLEQIQVCCDLSLSDNVTVRNKKFFFKPDLKADPE